MSWVVVVVLLAVVVLVMGSKYSFSDILWPLEGVLRRDAAQEWKEKTIKSTLYLYK